MTSLLVEDYREPTDCPYVWGDGYARCTWHDLPVHRCLVQGGHDGPCVCMCTDSPPPVLPQPQRVRWVGWLDECAFTWRNDGDQPCVPTNPTSSHMCVDGADWVDLGHEPHGRSEHTCRCGDRQLTRAGYRALRDSAYPHDPADLPDLEPQGEDSK